MPQRPFDVVSSTWYIIILLHKPCLIGRYTFRGLCGYIPGPLTL